MGRNVFITGATSGIGRETAIAFAKNGDNLLLCARRKDTLDEMKQGLEDLYKVDVTVFELDVTDRAAVAEKVPAMIESIGHVDILVNNAGLAQGLDAFEDSSIDDMETMIDTNVKGLLYVSRTVLPYMLKRNIGHIINLGSTAGIYAYAKGAVYCATKAAVKTLSDGIRIDTIESDIKVTTIQPGIVETPFSEVRFHGDKEKAAAVYAGVDALQPEDIADIILFASNRPRRVQISDITIMANQQATGFMIAKK
ncbi:SDR family NAD(P)-dependent oxidoreductase [uncultured Veillonella sp.]|jgi:3-hydroxy acid dehydrogenase/malonic semialdehyde reductase|uniref:SDR family NAD(P)-dependent oxidoreductase n=1 Tax=uncultured Veillonella sp. TaxID=159268 RepID=UPI002590EE17|nr:SDR family NAD(P)-dependent oxidoreductase [uncultured Veillonella sp.]